jgi:hypothetical protein
MTAKNDITGDSIVSKTNSDKYRIGYEVIFNKDKCERCGKTLFEDSIYTCTPKEINER